MNIQLFLGRFFKYLKWCMRGGYSELHLSQIQYPEVLKGKNIIITGGSDGIGLAMARKFIAAGANVLITGRNAERLEAAASSIDSTRLHTLQWDVSDMGDMDNCLEQAVKKLGGGILFRKQCRLPLYSPIRFGRVLR
jgi:3-oxoacyl-[acyl-carrier protein] reductase